MKRNKNPIVELNKKSHWTAFNMACFVKKLTESERGKQKNKTDQKIMIDKRPRLPRDHFCPVLLSPIVSLTTAIIHNQLNNKILIPIQQNWN